MVGLLGGLSVLDDDESPGAAASATRTEVTGSADTVPQSLLSWYMHTVTGSR